MYSAKTVFRSPLICEICGFNSSVRFSALFAYSELRAKKSWLPTKILSFCASFRHADPVWVVETRCIRNADTLESKMFKNFLIFPGHAPSISAKPRVALH